jgi:hypothetical protein
MGMLTPGGFGAAGTLNERASWVSGKFLSTEGDLISSPRALEWLYQRRSFGSVSFTGANDGFTCKAGAYSLSFGTGDEAALKRAGRYVPRPHLTSITTKNQGSGDISDIAMWDISFEYVVYSQGDFNAATAAFMIPGNFVNVTFGWNNDFGSVSIKQAVIYNFGWTYNLDGSWTCNASALAKTATAGGFVVKPLKKASTTKDPSGAEASYYGIGAQLQANADDALGLGRDEGGGVTNDGLEEGQAKASGGIVAAITGGGGGYGVIKIQKEAGAWEMLLSAGSANEIVVSFVQLKEVVSFLNASAMAPNGKIVSSEATFLNNFLLKSADPTRILMPGRGANYKETGGSVNDFSAIGGTFGKVEDIWISTGLIIEVENKLLERKKEGEEASYTVHQFMSQILKEIETETGSVVNCYLQSDPQSSGVKTYTIVNRHNDITGGAGAGYTFKTLTPNSIIKGISMSSNLDAEMSAIAYTGGGGKYPKNAINNVFNCTPKNPNGAAGALENTNQALKEKIKQMGDNYNSNEVSDFRTVLRKHFMSNLFPSGKSIPYAINLSVTFDGVDGIQFFNTFTVDNLPGGFGDVFFAVGEIEHSVSNGNWDTTIVGYMMINT